jgi:hypothetical protein
VIGIKKPAFNSLKKIADYFGLPVWMMLIEADHLPLRQLGQPELAGLRATAQKYDEAMIAILARYDYLSGDEPSLPDSIQARFAHIPDDEPETPASPRQNDMSPQAKRPTQRGKAPQAPRS